MSGSIDSRTTPGTGMVDLDTAAPVWDASVRHDISSHFETFYFNMAAVSNDATPFASFFLLAGGLHFMAALWEGHSVTGLEFKAFCNKFLPDYDVDSMYSSLRCGLFHMGAPDTEDGRGNPVRPYTLTQDLPNAHNPGGEGDLVLDADRFLEDLRNARDEMLKEIDDDAARQGPAVSIFNKKRLVIIAPRPTRGT